jgi:hypothetical protein
MAHKESKVSSRNIAETLSSTQNPAPEDYQRQVAEAAYYRALARGFQGGDPVDDWLQAEQEIRNKSNP